jgi:hypothetical protein
LLATFAVAKDFPVTNGQTNPALQGTVKAEIDRNGNAAFELEAKHIAPPQRLTPAKQFYVLWVQVPGKPAESQGELRVNSENMAASFKGTTPNKSFEIIVTAEDQPKPESPSNVEILRAQINL